MYDGRVTTGVDTRNCLYLFLKKKLPTKMHVTNQNTPHPMPNLALGNGRFMVANATLILPPHAYEHDTVFNDIIKLFPPTPNTPALFQAWDTKTKRPDL